MSRHTNGVVTCATCISHDSNIVCHFPFAIVLSAQNLITPFGIFKHVCNCFLEESNIHKWGWWSSGNGMVPWTIVRESVMKNKNSNEKKRVKTKRDNRKRVCNEKQKLQWKKKESKLKDNKGIKLERFSEKNPEHAQT